jgi:hypothetical protein
MKHVVALALLAFSATAARAEQVARVSMTPDPRLHLDLEVDPIAYVFSGYSFHAGLGWKRVRLDLGAFGMELPSFVQSNRDFDVSFTGFGAKLQYFAFAEQQGGFVGVDSGVTWERAERTGSQMASRDRQVSVGVNAGWRFTFGDHFYATPWLGVSYTFGTTSTTLGGSTFEPVRLNVFPTVHLGYRFQ